MKDNDLYIAGGVVLVLYLISSRKSTGSTTLSLPEVPGESGHRSRGSSRKRSGAPSLPQSEPQAKPQDDGGKIKSNGYSKGGAKTELAARKAALAFLRKLFKEGGHTAKEAMHLTIDVYRNAGGDRNSDFYSELINLGDLNLMFFSQPTIPQMKADIADLQADVAALEAHYADLVKARDAAMVVNELMAQSSGTVREDIRDSSPDYLSKDELTQVIVEISKTGTELNKKNKTIAGLIENKSNSIACYAVIDKLKKLAGE